MDYQQSSHAVRQSKAAAGPVESFNDGELPPLPPELWKKILSNLDGVDFLNAMHAYGDFYNVMSERRTKSLFPLISKRLAPCLPFSDFLKLRKVCRDWRNGVDLVYEEFPYGIRMDDPNPGAWFKEGLVGTSKPGVTLRLSSEIDKFMRDMADSVGNPFVGHQLTIQCQDEDSVCFFDVVGHLLDAFGQHVWRLVFTIERVEDFHQCIQRMPQLRAIETDHSLDTNDHYLSVVDYLEMHPIPQFPHLQILVSDCFQRSVFAEQLAYNHALNLRQLSLETPFIALDITAALLTKVEFLGGCCSLEGLRTIAANRPPLKSVHIDVIAENGQYLDALEVFQCLSTFRLTLQSAFLCGNFAMEHNRQLLTFEMNMPKLETFKLMFYKGPLDPLLSCGNLKVLWLINYNLLHSANPESKVDFKITNKLTLSSNLWSLLPRLKTIVMPRPLDSARRCLEFKRMQ